MPQLFRRRANTIARCVLAALLIVPLSAPLVVYAVMSSPYATAQWKTVNQPVPFSHQHHVGGLGLDCRYCHASVEQSPYAGMPATSVCMTCHSELWTNAAMLAPVRASLDTGEPIHWRRVTRLPDYVYFDHSVHVHNGVGCTTCHGRVDRMPLLHKAAPMTMSWCLSCHRDPTPYLRAPEAIFDPAWTPPADQQARGAALLVHYHIETRHLTDCSVCHR